MYFQPRSFLHIQNKLFVHDYATEVYNYVRKPNNAEACACSLFQ